MRLNSPVERIGDVTGKCLPYAVIIGYAVLGKI